MKAIVLYSQHDSSKDVALAIADRLTSRVKTVELIEVFGSELGMAVKNVLEPREFPCVILIQEHLQGAAIANPEYLSACMDEQQDVETREFYKLQSNHLEMRLVAEREKGVKEIEPLIKDMTELLFEGGVL